MESNAAAEDLQYIRRIMDRAGRSIDPHLFHLVHWGAIVLLWYPAENLLERAGHSSLEVALGGVALLLGAVLSATLEFRLKGRPRLEGGNPHVERQVLFAVFGPLVLGTILSALGPATGFIEGPFIPCLWGLVYALIAYGVGIVYTPEWIWAGAFIFAGTIAAILVSGFAGIILGPTMGLGMIVPGIIAERRVKRIREEDAGGK
jgi:MFS family permease